AEEARQDAVRRRVALQGTGSAISAQAAGACRRDRRPDRLSRVPSLRLHDRHDHHRGRRHRLKTFHHVVAPTFRLLSHQLSEKRTACAYGTNQLIIWQRYIWLDRLAIIALSNREDTMKTNYKIAIALVAGAAIGGTATQGLHAQSKPPVY